MTRFLPAAALVLCAELRAQARPDTARADSARAVDAVTVTESRAPSTVGGASSVTLRVDELRASPAPLLEEALRQSPFVHVRQNSRGEMEISVRGSDSRQAAVLMDGVPLTLGWDHRTDPSVVPITGAQSLVIVRGLGSVLNGPNTLGGTIEVSHDDAIGRLGSGRVWGGAGFDETAAYVASIGAGRDVGRVGAGVLALRAGVAHRARDGFPLPAAAVDPTAADGLRTNSDLRETDGFVSARWRSPRGRALGLMVTAFEAQRGVPPEEHLAAPRLWRYPHHARAVAALSTSAGAFATPFGFATLDLGAGLNTGRLKIESFADRTYSSVVASELGEESTWTMRGSLAHSLPRGARLKTALTLATVDHAETLAGDTAVDYRQQLLSAGAEVELPLTGRTTVALGAVHDEAATPLTGGRPRQGGLSAPGWRAGVTYELAAGIRVHANASRRSRFPALRELYSGALNRFVPNPGLEPETLLGMEAGFTMDRRLGPIPDVALQINAFHHDLDDAVVRTTLPPPDGRFLRVNRDRIRSTGVEFLGGLAFGRDRARSISLTADATIQDVRILDKTAAASGIRHPENNPESRAMLEVGVPLPLGIRGFANVRYAGVQYCLNADAGAEMALPASTELNAALEHRLPVASKGPVRFVRALLAVDNASNTTSYDQCGLVQPGRTLRLMLSFQ